MKIEKIKEKLHELEKDNNYRILKKVDNKLCNLSSNDYLGIAQNNRLKEEFYKKYKPRLSSSSSRLITGSSNEVMELEKLAEKIYNKPCLVFNSGFDANSSVIETLYNKESLIITDKLNHNSIYTGIINSKAKFLRYRHLDLEHLEEILLKYQGIYEDILVVTETIYSMDGDMVDIEKIVHLKKKYGFLLMVDEAHSYGVYSYGISHSLHLVKNIDFLIIPLGKGGASIGAMVICDENYKKYLINKSNKFIFSTALPPINYQWNLFILENMKKFENERKKLRELKEFTLAFLREKDILTVSTTHIISIIIGDKEKLIKIQKKMKEKGFLLYGVKEPSVPEGSSRFRIGLNPTLSKELIKNFIRELSDEINNII